MAAPLFGAGNAAFANSTSVTAALTIGSESNKVLYLYVGSGAANVAPTSVTWDGVSVGAAIASGTFNGGSGGWWLYRVIAPAAVTADAVATWAASTQRGIMPFYYYDVDQTTPNDAPDLATGSGTAAQNTVASATGDTCVAMFFSAGTTTKAPASGETERVDVSTSSPGLYELAGGASLSFDITMGTSREWMLLGMNLNEVTVTETVMEPDPVVIDLGVPAPAFALTLDIEPSPVALDLVVPAPVMETGVNVRPDPLALTMVIPAPSFSFSALTVTPAPVTLPLVVAEPAVDIDASIEVTPQPVELSLSFVGAPSMPSYRYIIEVDWDGDGDFNDPHENVTDDALTAEGVRGKDYASQLVGRVTAGKLQVVLLNRDGKYSPLNSTSPIYGDILPNREIRVRAAGGNVLWTGVLSTIEPVASVKEVPKAILRATGVLVRLSGSSALVSPPVIESGSTGDAIEAILDEVDWDVSRRNIDTDGLELPYWFKESSPAIDAMQELEETEIGSLFEGLNWDIIFETRYHRFLNNPTSQATFSDDSAASLQYVEITQQDFLREIFNYFEATIQPYYIAGLELLWSLSETPVLQPAESVTYTATYKGNSGEGLSFAFVKEWQTPTVGVEILQVGVSNSDIGISVVKRASSMDITVTNNHGSLAATITQIQAYGVPAFKTNAYKVAESDATSIAKYLVRRFPLPSPWYWNSAYARAAAQYFLLRHKEPAALPVMRFIAPPGSALEAQAWARQLSDRITLESNDVTKLGINGDFHIESIRFFLGAKSLAHFEYSLSPAYDESWFILDSSELDGPDELAY